MRKSTVSALQQMGIRAIRVGGSFASVTGWPDGGGGTPPSDVSGSYYQWQKWTGPPWTRPSVGAVWNAYRGTSYSLIGGWGPFEVIDMAAAMGIEPIITTTSSSSPTELADLVEYCWGDANTTMGAKRSQDGHPGRYELRFIELGNEQYNSNYVDQVAAMEAKATALGVAGELKYIFPAVLNDADVAKARALGIDEQLAIDMHVGAGGAVDTAKYEFGRRPTFGMSAINLETNAATHDHARALAEVNP